MMWEARKGSLASGCSFVLFSVLLASPTTLAVLMLCGYPKGILSASGGVARSMRVLGVRVHPIVARFARVSARKLRAWPSESFLKVGGRVFVRSWSMESLPRLQRLFGGDFYPENLVELKIWRPWWALPPSLFRVGVVLTCEPYGRFRNRILQTAVGVAAATHLGAQQLILRTDDFPATTDVMVLDGLVVEVARSPGQKLRVRLAGRQPRLIVEANWLLSQAALSDRGMLAHGFSQLRDVTPLSGKQIRGGAELVMHFRGTDQIAATWRPPPLAYYLRVVNHSDAQDVALVTDDPEHFLVAELVQKLEERNVRVSIVSGLLEEDSAVIAGATTLCLGIGTFSSSLAGVSRDLSVAYSWMQPNWSNSTQFYGTFDIRPDVTNIRVFDSAGDYLALFTKHGDLTEKDLIAGMTRYPESALGIRE